MSLLLSTGPHRDHLGSYFSEFSVFPNLTLLPDWTSSLLPGALQLLCSQLQMTFSLKIFWSAPPAHEPICICPVSSFLPTFLHLDLFYPCTSVPICITSFLLCGQLVLLDMLQGPLHRYASIHLPLLPDYKGMGLTALSFCYLGQTISFT